MRPALILTLTAATFLAQQQLQPPRGTIEGVAFAFGQGKPLADATVELIIPGGARRNQSPARTTKTDAAGKFLFTDVDPGSYTLAAGAGFTYAGNQRDFNSVTVTVAPGQLVSGLRLPIVSLSTITGRVLDEKDLPQSSVQLELYELVYAKTGEKYLGQSRGSATTDQSGNYRMVNVEPGEFYLVARPMVGQSVFPTTFYPGVVDAENAATVVIPFSSSVTALDVRLTSANLHTIRVKVPRPTDVPKDFTALFTVTTESRGRFTTALMLPGAVVSAFKDLGNDSYISPPLPPDTYTVAVTWRAPSGGFSAAAMMSSNWRNPRARFRVELNDENVDAGVVSDWITPASISGRAYTTGLPQPYRFEGITVQLDTTEPVGDLVRLDMLADGTIKGSAAPGHYAIRAQLPPDLYLTSARFAGREVLDSTFLVEKDSMGPLEITISRGAGVIEGVARTATRDTAPFARVLLVPAVNRRANWNLYSTVVADQNGAFSISRIPPGDYTILAWDWVRLHSYFNADVLREFEGRGQKITVVSGSRHRVTVQAIEGFR